MESSGRWKPGPVPPGTYGWGGVVPHGYHQKGFFFASFEGNKVVLAAGPEFARVLQLDEVKLYDNSLSLPPAIHPREKRLQPMSQWRARHGGTTVVVLCVANYGSTQPGIDVVVYRDLWSDGPRLWLDVSAFLARFEFVEQIQKGEVS